MSDQKGYPPNNLACQTFALEFRVRERTEGMNTVVVNTVGVNMVGADPMGVNGVGVNMFKAEKNR